MDSYRARHTSFIVAIGVLIGLSRWLLPLSDAKGRVVIACGLVLIAIDLTILQYRLLRRLKGVRVVSRLALLGLLTGSTVLVSALVLPRALAEPEWLAGCDAPLPDVGHYGNFGPDYLLESRHPMIVGPADVEAIVATWDGYDGRSEADHSQQIAESIRIEFYLGGVLQGASAASADLADGVEFAEWFGSLGIVALPNGADEVVVSHNANYTGQIESNSVSTNGVCLTIDEYPPPTTTTIAPPTTIAPSTTITATTAAPSTTTSLSVPPTTVTPTTLAPTTIAPATTTSPTTVPPATTSTAPPTTTTPTTIAPATTTTASTTTTSTSTTSTTTTSASTSTTTTTSTTSTTTTTLVPSTTTMASTTTSVAPTTTVTPTTSPPTTVPPEDEPAINTLTSPPVDRIGTPPSTLAYTGSTIVNIATSAWLFIIAGLSVLIIFDPQPVVRRTEVL